MPHFCLISAAQPLIPLAHAFALNTPTTVSAADVVSFGANCRRGPDNCIIVLLHFEP